MHPDKGGWRVRWRKAGTRHSRWFPDKATANKFELELKLGIADQSSLRGSPTFAEFGGQWLKGYCEVERAESQWQHDRSVIEHHLNPALGQIRLRHLQKSHLIALRAFLKDKVSEKTGRRLSTRSVNNAIGLAKSMLNYAVDLDLIPLNPFLSVRPLKSTQPKIAFWTPSERDTFIAKAEDLDPAFAELVTIACHTGLRLGELAGLTCGDIDLGRRKLFVWRSFNLKLGKYLPTKNRRLAEVPLNGSAYAALATRATYGKEELVFSRSLFTNARRRLHRLCRLAGVRSIRFHDLRHTFASTLAMAGVDLMLIQQLMRHSSYQMTLRYAHLPPGHCVGATDVLVPKLTRPQPEERKTGAVERI